MEKFIRASNPNRYNLTSAINTKTNGLSTSVFGCFGVGLDELCSRDGQTIPLVMIQMCAFLRAVGGLHTEGVFRVNGNSRVVENLRNAADSATSIDGDLFLAHLERYGDVHSVASLIKLFLRELPIGLVPPPHTKKLLEVLACQGMINQIMSELVERSDVIFTRKSTIEIPSAPLLGIKHGGVALSSTRLVDRESMSVNSQMEVYQRTFDNHQPRTNRFHVKQYAFPDTDTASNSLAAYAGLEHPSLEHGLSINPSNTEKQAVVMNLATDVAEQLSTTLQACLRACVRQHALPSNRRSGYHPLAQGATTIASPHTDPNRLDQLAVRPVVSLLSPFNSSSNPHQQTFTPQMDSNPRFLGKRLNGSSVVSSAHVHQFLESQIPPSSKLSQSRTAFAGLSSEEVSQVYVNPTTSLLSPHSGDIGVEEAVEPQDVGVIASAMHSILPRASDSDNKTVVSASEGTEGSYCHGQLAIGEADLGGLSKSRTSTHSPKEPRRMDCVVEAYVEMMQKLAEKRQSANRPERLLDMTLLELETEKQAIQRALLAFETAYGRPRERNDRVVMRPVYDRYRCIKRLLAGATKHRCSSPSTPARIFAPPEMLDPVAAQSVTPQSTHSEHVPSAALFGELTSGGAGDPVSVRHRSPSIDNSDCPQLHYSTVSSLCTSLLTSANSKTSDEWFGSLGISRRLCGQRIRSPWRHEEGRHLAEKHYEEVRCGRRTQEAVGENRSSDNEKEEEEGEENEEEEQTMGRRTPVNQNPLLQPSPSPTYEQTRSQSRHLCANMPVLTVSPRQQWFVSTFEDDHSQLLSHPPRQLSLFPAAYYSHRRHQQQQNHGGLAGDDPESGKPLDQAIADYVAKYAEFTFSELQIELNSVKESKKMLQKFLKEFEHDFEKKNGRKVEMGDRQPLNLEYLRYKMLKARLTSLERLLEARSAKV